ncbi:MAG TPA: endo-1,4-beta-xylanase, partial [bacterium]|nr:endo-1,4-beta-xylanase [bacterium]
MPSLAAVYKSLLPIGAAVDPYGFSINGDLLAAQVSSLVAENAMKWQSIHPRPGNDPSSYSFGGADAVVAFAQQHGMLVRGHTLVWHNQVPDWVFRGANGTATRAELLDRLQGHITTVLAHFKGSVYAWDVVNEAVSDGAGMWRDTPWYQIDGADQNGDGIPEYIEKAYQWARAADPAAELFYNDYNIESGPKLEKAFTLVKALKARGLIDGVGIQGHWSIYSASPATVRAAIDRFASLGVKVQITELDLSLYQWGDTSSLDAPPADRLKAQADAYAGLFQVFRDEATAGKLTGVTFWGISDDHTWLDSFP